MTLVHGRVEPGRASGRLPATRVGFTQIGDEGASSARGRTWLEELLEAASSKPRSREAASIPAPVPSHGGMSKSVSHESTYRTQEGFARDLPDDAVSETSRAWQILLGLARFAIDVALIVAIAAATPAVLSKALNTRHPIATITSQSMWPALRRGDMVLIRGVDPKELRPGMIVVYKGSPGDAMIIHRIVKIDGPQVLTKGDANDSADEPITASDISGAVPTVWGRSMKVPYLGYLTLLVRGGPGQ